MSRAGFALVEMLVTIGSALLVVALVAGTVPVHARAFAGGRDRQELRSSVRRIVDALAREARGLGFDPIENPADASTFDGRADGLALAAVDRIEMRSDHHGAGGSGPPDDRLDTGSDERITFAWSSGTMGITQSIGGLDASLAQGMRIRSGDFRIRYFDACGSELVAPPGGLGASDRRRVVAIMVSLAGAHPGVGGAESATTTVALRNRRGLRCPTGVPW